MVDRYLTYYKTIFLVARHHVKEVVSLFRFPYLGLD